MTGGSYGSVSVFNGHVIVVIAVLYIPLLYFWRRSLFLFWQSWLLGSLKPLWKPQSVAHLMQKLHFRWSLELTQYFRSRLLVTYHNERLRACIKICFRWPSIPIASVSKPKWVSHLFKLQRDCLRQVLYSTLYRGTSTSPRQEEGKTQQVPVWF